MNSVKQGSAESGVRFGMQKRLIVAFLLMGLVPMILAMVLVMSVKAQWENDIQAKVDAAAELALKTIEEKKEQSRSKVLRVREEPRFKDWIEDLAEMPAGTAKWLEVLPGEPFLLWYPGRVPTIVYELPLEEPLPAARMTVQTFMVLREDTVPGSPEPGRSLLAACAVLPVWQGDVMLGNLIAGNELDVSFIQYLESVGVTADLDIISGSGEDVSGDPESESFFPRLVREAVRSSGRSYRVHEFMVAAEPYEALYVPLFNHRGDIKALLFLGVSKRYALGTVTPGRMVLLGIAWVVVASALGYAFARRMSRPVQQMAAAARAVREGDLDHEIEARSHDEIGDLAAAFNEMVERLRHLKDVEEELRRSERLAALGELSAGVAHEIRNPLGIIRNSAQMLHGSLDRKDRVEELSQFIIEEVDRLNRVVSNLLDFARPQEPRLESTELVAVIEHSLLVAGPAIEKAGVKVVREMDGGTGPVLADRELLGQVFLNLLLNAAQASDAGGSITVKLRAVGSRAPRRRRDRDSRRRKRAGEPGGGQGGMVEVVVADTGHGIPDDELSRIFNPFYSGREGGSGLGLAIVHRIVEMHRGEIGVESKPGQGSAFTVRLPAAPGGETRRSAIDTGEAMYGPGVQRGSSREAGST